jgi:putative sigma-54 modulation protein
MLHGGADDGAWEPSLTAALEKVVRQGRKIKGKWQERKRRATRAEAVPERVATAEGRERSSPRIVRTPRHAVKPMTIEEAAEEVGAGRDGFLVFRNAVTDSINVLYRRKNGDFGLIEPEA